jgi:hypothetical protein
MQGWLWRGAAGLTMALTAAACCKDKPPELPAGYQILQGEPDEADPISRNVLLIADNQQHFLYGEPVWIRATLIDKLVGSAIRSPQLDLYAPAVLRWILEEHAERTPVIHLGDALDVSCQAELDAFLVTMRHAKAPWVMAPGNHDGLFFGNVHGGSEWDEACDGGGKRLDKAMFVKRYLRQVLAAPSANDAGMRAFAAAFDGASEGEWAYSGSERVFLSRVAWRIDDQAPWRSFVVQQVSLDFPGAAPVRALLVDTASYSERPILLPTRIRYNAGWTGEIHADQAAKVTAWLQQAQVDGATTMMMGHHPFDDLESASQRRMDDMRRRFGVLLYASAHTHAGGYRPHRDGGGRWLELNVGSTIDWPLELRELQLVSYPTPEGTRQYTSSPLSQIGWMWGEGQTEYPEGPDCHPSWQPTKKDGDFYVDYADVRRNTLSSTETSFLLLDALLHSYRRLLNVVPTDAANTLWPPGASSHDEVMRAVETALAAPTNGAGLAQRRQLLIALEHWDAHRAVPATITVGTDEREGPIVHRDFRLCQAWWASQDDEKGFRQIRSDDWYIVRPPPPSAPTRN